MVSVLSGGGGRVGKMKNPPAEATGGGRASASVRRLPYIRRSRPARNIADQSDGRRRRCQRQRIRKLVNCQGSLGSTAAASSEKSANRSRRLDTGSQSLGPLCIV